MELSPPWNAAPGRSAAVAAATRLLATSVAAREVLPPAFQPIGAFDLLLAMLVAEDRGDYLSSGTLAAATGGQERLIERWIGALGQAGLVETRLDVVALSGAGYALVIALIARTYDGAVVPASDPS